MAEIQQGGRKYSLTALNSKHEVERLWLVDECLYFGPKRSGLRTLERISSSEWVPLINLDMKFVINDSCSDVLFVDWVGKVDYDGLEPPLLVTCNQGYGPNI